jgi:hypothetical protein
MSLDRLHRKRRLAMPARWSDRLCVVLAATLLAPAVVAAQPGSVKGSFVLNGVDAGLTNVRAIRAVLDDGRKKINGYTVLLSAKPAPGDVDSWRTADPSERGSFIYLMLEPDGTVWVAELGHAARKGGRFGVMLEVKKAAFEVKGDVLRGHFRTAQEEEFLGAHYTIDLTFETTLEGK